MWQSWGYSIRGKGHIINDLPNQDSFIVQSQEVQMVVVSDGLGSKRHSNIGSKAICDAVKEILNHLEDLNKTSFIKMLHETWLELIKPYDPKECMATCLIAVVIDHQLLIITLGDGMVVVLGKQNRVFMEKQAFSNMTSAVGPELNLTNWQFETLSLSDVDCILACTDGVSDDLEADQIVNFSKKVSETYDSMAEDKRAQDIRYWLNHWPVKDNMDDKTIACLYRGINEY